MTGIFSRHIPDHELVLAADGELTPRLERRLRRHLAGCTACTARARQVERALRDVVVDGERVELPPAGPARARLRSRLADLSHEPPARRGNVYLWAAACVVVALTAGLGSTLSSRNATPAGVTADGAHGVFLLPRADLTPGLARDVAVEALCASTPRPAPAVPEVVHRNVFASYGADFTRASEYELDYLITPELGGAPDPQNLWPQPFARTEWNAYVKDELELYLHQLVCDGAIDLETAQRELSVDWIGAYKRHFDTDRPRRDYAEAPLTEHDGDLLRAELAELGIAPPDDSDGVTMLALLQSARQNAWR